MSVRGVEDVHTLFGLSYANFLTLPRTLLQSMPEEWQRQFADLMSEYDEHWSSLPDGFQPDSYRVQPTENGRLAPWSDYRLPHYSRGRARVSADGSVTGAS